MTLSTPDNQAQLIAGRFTSILQSYLRERWHDLVAANRCETGDCCPSHDFCDSNMAMLAAFEGVTGRKPSADSDEDNGLWNDAWTLARKQWRD